MSEWLVLAAAGPGQLDGIGDYAWQLTRALSVERPATLIVRQPVGARAEPASPSGHAPDARLEYVSSWAELSSSSWIARGHEAAGVFLQYFPQVYAAAPDFGALIAWLRARHAAARPVVVTLHEYWPHRTFSPKVTVMRWLSRKALRNFVTASRAMVVSQPYSLNEVSASNLVPRGMLHVIPVGSAVPRLAQDRPPAASDPPTLVIFGQPGHVNAEAVGAVLAVARTSERPPRISWFSRSDEELRQWWSRHIGERSSEVTFYGGLSTDALSRRFQEGTLGLALYVDGASTRRSSLAALLEHRLPIAGLDGDYTDDRIRESGAARLVPSSHPDALAAVVRSLLADPPARAALSLAAGRFFADYLAWPRIAAAYRALSGAA